MNHHGELNHKGYQEHIAEQQYMAWWDTHYHAAYNRALSRIEAWLESADALQRTAVRNGFLDNFEQWQEGNYAEALLDGNLSLTHIMFLGITEKVWEYTKADTWFGYTKTGNEAADTAWDIAIYDAIQAVKNKAQASTQ